MNKANVRLGTTSYILADDILPNVKFLAPLVDDIELVLFESEEMSNLPSPEVIDELASLALEHNLSYTVHFPLDSKPGSSDAVVRAKCVSSILSILELTKPLSPFGYVMHLTPELYGYTPSSEVLRWKACLSDTLATLFEQTSLNPRLFCIETLSYPFSYVQDLVEQFNLSVTLDIGHIWLMGYDSNQALDNLLARTRICHLHGVREGKDHLALDQGDPKKIEQFLNRLKQQGMTDMKERVLTLEVFSEAEFFSSLSLLQESHDMMC